MPGLGSPPCSGGRRFCQANSREFFNEALAYHLDACCPDNGLEIVLVRELAECDQELRRLRKMEADWFKLLEDEGVVALLQRAGMSEGEADQLTVSWQRGEAAAVAKVQATLKRLQLTEAAISSSTLLCRFDDFRNLREMIKAQHGMRNSTLRALERQQRLRAARQKPRTAKRPAETYQHGAVEDGRLWKR